MEKVTSPVLKKIFSQNRSRFNTAFARAVQERGTLDEEKFVPFFLQIVGPLINAGKGNEYARLESAVIKIFDILLSLAVRGYVSAGGRHPHFEGAFSRLLEHFKHQLIDSPDTLMPALANAVIQVSASIGERTEEWIDILRGVSDTNEALEKIKGYGLIAAWRCGMARFRDEALRLSETLPPDKFSRLFGIAGDSQENVSPEEMLPLLKRDRWSAPADIALKKKTGPLVRTTGGFTGFGGQFRVPPSVYTDDEGIMADDGNRAFRLYADIFGSELLPVDEAPHNHDKPPSFSLELDGPLTIGNRKVTLPEKYRVPLLSLARHHKTLCFTSPLSHRIFIVGVPGSTKRKA